MNYCYLKVVNYLMLKSLNIVDCYRYKDYCGVLKCIFFDVGMSSDCYVEEFYYCSMSYNFVLNFMNICNLIGYYLYNLRSFYCFVY